MNKPPRLSRDAVRSWTSQAYFDRGATYYRQGRIVSPMRQERTIKAQCHGSRPNPYRVEATLGTDGIASAACSCPVGGSRCKHAVALLLTWAEEPDAFVEVEPLEQALQRRSKEQLVALVRRMVDLHPDLERLAVEPELKAGALSAEWIRQRVEATFDFAGYEWGAGYAIALGLDSLLADGRALLDDDAWDNAATLFGTTITEVLDQYEVAHDEEGEVLRVIDQCVQYLSPCLPHLDGDRREDALHALFDVYRWDVDFGGIGMGDYVPDQFETYATDDDRRLLAAWTRDALATAGSDWSRRAYGGLLIELEGDDLDDDAYEQLCLDAGRDSDLVDFYLTRGRDREATARARELTDYRLLELTPVFARHDRLDLVRPTIDERVAEGGDRRLAGWLRNDARRRGDHESALRVSLDQYRSRPSVPAFAEVRTDAQALNRWAEVRQNLLDDLEEAREFDLLARVYLEEGDVTSALRTYRRIDATSRPHYGVGSSLRLQLARAAEDEHPEEAIQLYLQVADGLIAKRGRTNYADAAGHLQRVRELYAEHLKRPDAWQHTIAGLREQYRQLRALKDELNKAGL